MSPASATSRSALGLVCFLVGVAGTAEHALAQGDDAAAFAQQRFSAGVLSFDGGDFEEALEHFTASYELFASPNSQLYIARSLRELNRLGDALRAFDRTVAEATDRAQTDPRYAETRDAAQAEGRQLRGRVGILAFEVDEIEGLEVTIDGEVVPAEALGLPMVVGPGSHGVRATATGHLPFEREVSVSAGETVRVPVELTREPVEGSGADGNGATGASSGSEEQQAVSDEDSSDHSGWTTAGWISAGVGAAALISFGTFAILADNRFADLEEKCGGVPGTFVDVLEGHNQETDPEQRQL